MATNAERLRRHRAHHRGDHSLCLPERECRAGRRVRSAPAVDESPGPGRGAPLPPAAERPAEARGERARELWDELAPQLGAAHRVILGEACRIADRLDRLDAIIDGNDEWLRIETTDGDVVVAVDAALAEARQQATALRGLLVELVKALPKTPARGGQRSGQPGKGGGLGDLSARIAARRGATSG